MFRNDWSWLPNVIGVYMFQIEQEFFQYWNSQNECWSQLLNSVIALCTKLECLLLLTKFFFIFSSYVIHSVTTDIWRGSKKGQEKKKQNQLIDNMFVWNITSSSKFSPYLGKLLSHHRGRKKFVVWLWRSEFSSSHADCNMWLGCIINFSRALPAPWNWWMQLARLHVSVWSFDCHQNRTR